MNWKIQKAGIQPGSGDPKAAFKLARQPESSQAPAIPIGVFTGDIMNMHMFLQTVAAARRWHLRSRHERPDEQAMRHLLNRRSRYAVDDIPHRDLLDCVAEDGTLLSFLEPGTTIGTGAAL